MKIQLHKTVGGGVTPIYARAVWIEFCLIGKTITITFPLPYLEVYTYLDMPDSPGDIEPFRLFPPDRWGREEIAREEQPVIPQTAARTQQVD